MILFLLCAPIWATEHLICNDMGVQIDGRSCTTTTLDATIAGMAAGDIATIRAGDSWTFGSTKYLPASNGSAPIIIRSDRWKEFRPGYRANQADKTAGRFFTINLNAGATLATPNTSISFTVDASTNVFTAGSAHGITDGTPVAVNAAKRSGRLCYGDGVPTWGSANRCSGMEADYFYDSEVPPAVPTWSDGMPFRLYGKVLPSELTMGGLYYARDVDGSGAGSLKFAATAGGAAITYPSLEISRALLLVVAPPPLESNTVYYTVNTASTTLQLALTPNGPPIDITGEAFGTIGIQSLASKTQNLTIIGMEIQPTDGDYVDTLLTIGGSVNHAAGLPTGIVLDHVYLHGRPNQNGPRRGVRFDGNGIIRDSWLASIKEDGADTQAIAQFNTDGKTTLINNHIEASGENYMSGGSHPSIREIIPSEVVLERNYFPMPPEWNWGGMYCESGVTNGFRIVSRYAGTAGSTQCLTGSVTAGVGIDCATANTNYPPSHQCYGYDAANTRYALTTDAVFDALSGSGTIAIGIRDGVGFYARYTNGVTLTNGCPTGFTCVQEAGSSIVWPSDAHRWWNAIVTSGATAYSDTGLIAAYQTKNRLEMKYGKNYTANGNVFHRAWLMYIAPTNTGGTSNGQWQGPTLHPQSVSTSNEKAAYWARVNNTTWRNTVLIDLMTGVDLTQGTSHSVRQENNYSDATIGNSFVNVLFFGNSNSMLGRFNDSGQQTSYSSSNNVWRMDGDYNLMSHWTVVDAELLSIYSTSTGAANNKFRDNVIIPIRRAHATNPRFPKVSRNGSSSAWCDMLSNGFNVGSTWEQTILMNRNNADTALDDVGTCGSAGVDWPTGTFLVTGDQNLASSLFTAWSESTCGSDVTPTLCVDRTSSTNLRIADANYKAGGANDATDGRDLGADIDEIEAETGHWGADVIAGIPPFRERSARIATPGSTTLALSYIPLTSDTCTLKIWDNWAYSGTPDIDTNDSGAVLSGGHRVLRITGLTASTQYWAKRWCATGQVDVFQFKTLSAAPPVTVSANGAALSAATAVIESGASASALSAGTPVTCTAACSLTVPSGDAYYRVAYLNGGGGVIARGPVSARP